MDRTRHVEIKPNHEAISWMDCENTKRQTQFQKPFKFRECNLFLRILGFCIRLRWLLSRCSRFWSARAAEMHSPANFRRVCRSQQKKHEIWSHFSLQQSAVLPFPETSVCCTSQRIPKFSVCQMTGVSLMYLSRSMSKAGEEEGKYDLQHDDKSSSFSLATTHRVRRRHACSFRDLIFFMLASMIERYVVLCHLIQAWILFFFQ